MNPPAGSGPEKMGRLMAYTAKTKRRSAGHRTLWSLLFLILPSLTFMPVGCVGTRTAKESLAREDLKETQAIYAVTTRTVPPLTESSTLPDLIYYAMMNNPRVESAFHEWRAAVETITTARSLPDPMLTLAAEVGAAASTLSAALMTDPAASWPGPGKRTLRADAAYGNIQQKRAVFEGELLATALAVKRAYYQLWVVQEQTRWTRKALVVVDEMEKLARAQLAAGHVTQQDVLRAEMERDRLKTELADLDDSRSPISARLRSSLGMGPGQSLPAFPVRLEPTQADLAEQTLLEAAFERNPRLKEMRGEVQQAVALFHLAKKASVPDFSFGLGAGGSPTTLMPSIGITLPIWRDKIAAEIAGARAGVEAAQTRLTAEELDLAVRFAETTFAWREADRQARLYSDRLLPKAEAALASAQAGYTGGIATFRDLLEAERTVLDYHVNHALAVGQRELALTEMSLVILGRWPEDVRRILPAEHSASADTEDEPPPEGRNKP